MRLLAWFLIFLSTLSLRRATRPNYFKSLWIRNFYPRSPCGERPWAVFLSCNYPLISIHALLAESDAKALPNSQAKPHISIHALLAESDLSRASRLAPVISISIHALLAESDPGRAPLSRVIGISIHALLAESDRTNLDKFHKDLTFLSTLSLRRATIQMFYETYKCFIFLSTLSLRRATLD